jgi:hypothetical protein
MVEEEESVQETTMLELYMTLFMTYHIWQWII